MVRRACLADVPWLVSQLREMDAAYGAKSTLFPGEMEVAEKLKFAIDEHLFLVAETLTGNKAGYIAGVVVPHFMNSKKFILTEYLWWVMPKYRRMGYGGELLAEFTRQGKDLADMVLMTSQVKTPLAPKSFEALGYTHLENSYLLEA